MAMNINICFIGLPDEKIQNMEKSGKLSGISEHLHAIHVILLGKILGQCYFFKSMFESLEWVPISENSRENSATHYFYVLVFFPSVWPVGSLLGVLQCL